MRIDRRVLLAGSASSFGLALGGCNSAPRTVRYRLKVEVDTPGGVRSGSSVLETTESYNDGLFRSIGNAVVFATRGEAAVVDLRARGLLFVLLTNDPSRPGSRTPFGAFIDLHRDLWDRDGIGPGAMDRFGAVRAPTTVPRQLVPLLVRFRDISDPRTVERADPADLASSFGPDVSFKRATIEITDDPVTTGIQRRLPWLSQSRVAGMLDGRRYHESNELANTLTANDFEGLWK